MDLIDRLRLERAGKLHGGIYDIIQKRFAYNSNKIEGSKLTQEQTNLIFETRSIANIDQQGINIDDIIESSNHFRCFDYILDTVEEELTQDYIKKLHALLKAGTISETNPLTPVGAYKILDNEVGQIATSSVEHTEEDMLSLLIGYSWAKQVSLERLARFHADFERIHPFADGNGRVGRLILFKECLKYGLVPFIVDDDNRLIYYDALVQAQTKEDDQALITYFKQEQAFLKNFFINKGFKGLVNKARPQEVIDAMPKN